jgi:hypothetical protein
MKGSERRRHQLISELRRLEKPRWRKNLSAAERQTIQRGWRYVTWTARRDLDLPSPGSPEDDAFGNLVAVDEVPGDLHDRLSRYVAGKLDALARETAVHRFEREIGAEGWKRIFSSTDQDLGARYIRNRLGDWELWHDTLSAFLNARPPGQEIWLTELNDELRRLFEDLANRFPLRANVEYDWGNYHRLFLPLLVQAATNRTEAHQPWRDWLRRWLRQNWGKLNKQSRALGEFGAIVFGPDEYREILGLASPDDLVELREWNSEVFRRLAEVAPVGIAEILARWWDDRSFEEAEWTWAKKKEWERGRQLRALIPLVDPRALERLALQLGFTVGLVLAKLSFFMAKQGQPVTDESPEVARELEKVGLPTITEHPEAVRFQSMLWRDLQILAKYEKESYRRGTELLGLRTSLLETASAHPAEWARALPWILECSQHLDSLAEAITVTLMQEAKEVAAAVEALASADMPDEVRNRARGLQGLAHGLLDPGDRLRQDLLSFAARQFDGQPFAAQVLAAPSSTWLNSYDMEALLRSCAGEAESRFREYFLTQGGIEEEAVTGRLLAELERAFGAARARVQRVSGTRRRLPMISLAHRQVPKKEEKSYGCDVAFLVSVAGHRIQGAEAAEFVQVKKPLRERSGRAFVDRWRIDSRQLTDLLHTSSSAVYWLLGAQGEVLVVPTKALSALASLRAWPRHSNPPSSFQLSYFRLRSAAIPLSQFLIDLLVGLWLGTTESRALEFAKGKARATVPRFIVEVTVDLTGEGQG